MASNICWIPSDVSVPPRFVVNLDQPANVRWQHITRIYVAELRDAQEQIERMLSDHINGVLKTAIETVVSNILSASVKTGLVFYGDELLALAKDSGIELGRLTLMQFIYECVACCTSIIYKDENSNVPMHIRTMDWSLDLLKKLTIDVDFQKAGRSIYKATTWVGYVGVLTGMRLDHGYSVAVNFRYVGGALYENLKLAILRGWPIGFLVRHTLEEVCDYHVAVEQLAQSVLIAPCYFTVCGPRDCTTKGTLLTRTQKTEENRLTLTNDGSIVQTNIDHWSTNENEDILYSIRRRALARDILSERNVFNEDDLWTLVSRAPILNTITIYGTFMCPEYNVYHTRLPHKKQGFMSYLPIQFVPASELKDMEKSNNPIKMYTCRRCNEKFDIDNNPGGHCVHTGKWHARYEDCSYLKCGFELAKMGSIGLTHWSCCYSINFASTKCKKSHPHTFIEI